MQIQKSLVELVFLTLGLLVSVLCNDIALHECPCEENSYCDKHKNSLSNAWTTFSYETSENVAENRTVRLERDAYAGCDSSPSVRILVNLHDTDNSYGYHGQLHGWREGTEEVASFEINEQGILSLFPDKFHQLEQFTRESYCIRRINDSHSFVDICCGIEHKSCIRKCCPIGYGFTNNDIKNPCAELSKDFNLPVTNGIDVSSAAMKTSEKLKIRTGFPNCERIPSYNITALLSTSLTKFNISRQPFRLFRDGTLKYSSGGKSPLWRLKGEGVEYCVDHLAVAHDYLDMTCGADEQDVLILCTKPHKRQAPNQNDWIYRVVYMTGFVIAIIVLLATAIVHFLLWEKQNSHAWTILCYVVTLTFFYACLLIIYVEETRKRVSEHYVPYFSKQWCFALGVITHFMGIFSFAWLCVINFDLWWTFRILKPMNQRNLDLKRLLLYGSFAVAVPIAVVSIAYAFHISYENRSEPCRKAGEDATIYPAYGEDGCFLANSAQPYYFYIPVGILLLANLVFYLCTSCQMLKIYNATRRISSDRNTRKQKQSCELFLKLFLVMGTTWIFQVILSIVETDEQKWYSPFIAVLDLVNMFQAIAIFVIFVCKRETLRALEHKYACLKACLHPFRGVYRTPTIISRSTDGSTKMSRTEFTKNTGTTESGHDHRRDSELISFS